MNLFFTRVEQNLSPFLDFGLVGILDRLVKDGIVRLACKRPIISRGQCEPVEAPGKGVGGLSARVEGGDDAGRSIDAWTASDADEDEDMLRAA